MDESNEVVDARVGKYLNIGGFHLVSADDNFIKGWVRTEEDLDRVIDVHSIDTSCQFTSWHDDKKRRAETSNSRILWKNKDIPIEGFPFRLGRHVIRQCQYGKPHKKQENKTNKVVDLHDYAQQKRFHLQPTRKVGCMAKLVIRYVTVFTEEIYCISENATARKKQAVLNQLREEEDYLGERRIYVTLPTEKEHSNHVVNKESVMSKRIHPRVKDKIYHLVSSGITNVPLVKKALRLFVETEFAKDEIKPLSLDRSYYPTSKDIKNHVHSAIVAGRLADLDQENVRRKVEVWQKQDHERKFFYRPATTAHDSDEESSRFLLVHQENWQRKMLQTYGNTICLLDATYKTTKYALPFFQLVVRTNVNYIPVAEFVTEGETAETIREALTILKSWNPNWNPSYFMVDYSEAEINAIEAEFPLVEVFICAFHREQAWERWSRDGSNIRNDVREDFLAKMRNIAYANTIDAYNEAVNLLTASEWFIKNTSAQSYIKNKWLNIKEISDILVYSNGKMKRWCHAFMDLGFNTVVKTNNGVENLNKSLKHFYLKLSSTGSLSNLMELVVQDFLPDLFQTYRMLNYRSSSNYKSYAADIPEYLHDRPHRIVEHCMKRLHSSDQCKAEDVSSLTNGAFCVKSKMNSYEVNFGSNDTYPFCNCEDFRKNYLPCKHFFAVFRILGKSWDDLSLIYRDSPYLKLDKSFSVDSNDSIPSGINGESISNSEEVGDIQPEKNLHVNDGPTCVEKEETSEVDLKFCQREVVADLKELQNLAYLCTDVTILVKTTEDLQLIKSMLSDAVTREAGLPVDQSRVFRKLPTRKKYPKKLKRFQKRVGVKAGIMKKSTCTGLPEQSNSCTESVLKGTKKHIKGQSRARKRKQDSNSGSLPKRKKVVTFSTKLDNINHEQGSMQFEERSSCEAEGENLSVVEADRAEALKLVQRLWSLKKDFDVPVAKVHGITVTDTDIRSLRQEEWLTDKVLDCYLSLLVTAQNDLGGKIVHYVQSTMTSIINRKFSLENIRKQTNKLSESTTVVGIYYRSGHWTLVIVDLKAGRIYFYNPAIEQAVEMRKILKSWSEYITEYTNRFKEDLVTNWTIHANPHSRQKDSYNCGVYCLMFAEKHLTGQVESLLDISNSRLWDMRQKTAVELMLYEVFLTGCCPKCGFEIGDEEAIECGVCKRSYHFKGFCIEEELADFGRSTEFTCRLCRINFWPVAQISNDIDETMDKREKSLKTVLCEDFEKDILCKKIDDITCSTFLDTLSHTSFITVEGVAKSIYPLLTQPPLLTEKKFLGITKLGMYGDGYIVSLPQILLQNYYIALQTQEGPQSLFEAVSLFVWGKNSRMYYLLLCCAFYGIVRIKNLIQKISNQHLGSDRQDEENQIKMFTEEIQKLIKDQTCKVSFQLFLLSNYLQRQIIVHKDGSQEVYGEEYNGDSDAIQIVNVGSMHYIPMVKTDQIKKMKEDCGAQQFGICKNEILDKWICCSACFQWYHDGCIGVNASEYPGNREFLCGCTENMPYKSKDLRFYKDTDKIRKTFRKIGYKKILKDLQTKKRKSWRLQVWNTKSTKRRKVLAFNCGNKMLSFEMYLELQQEVSSILPEISDKMIMDVYMPEIIVAVVSYQERRNILQAELLIKDLDAIHDEDE